jgi:hypothetical protein
MKFSTIAKNKYQKWNPLISFQTKKHQQLNRRFFSKKENTHLATAIPSIKHTDNIHIQNDIKTYMELDINNPTEDMRREIINPKRQIRELL